MKPCNMIQVFTMRDRRCGVEAGKKQAKMSSDGKKVLDRRQKMEYYE